ncbi:MAG: protein kinase [Pirellulales bacterium]|nr:protein kinase [Pirellulales bacterium]
MLICPGCSAEVDKTSLAAGRCKHCSSALHNVPQRTIQDVRQVKQPAQDEPNSSGELDTVDPAAVSREGRAETETGINPGTVENREFDPRRVAEPDAEDGGRKPPTVTISGEKTIDFGGSINLEEVTDSMVTAQWLDNITGGETGTNVTVKQKETVSSTQSTSSSLVVKSRQFRTGPDVGQPISSPDDAPDYELLSKIGEGGMGVVYAARQSSIARTVAVKMLKGIDAQEGEKREKFISEAVVTGELDHPNIVPIYDLGSNDSGALFYSMKRVRGTSWDDVVLQRSLDENLNILLRVADAVAFAHANGVLHRDLKPQNVMLGDFGEVLVMDWGLARISPEFPSAEVVSQSDVMGGTPAYMAPEMATGPIDQITIASDIYLLGAILYEVLTGKPPHSGKTVMACLFAAAKNKILPSDKSGELMDLALRAMATQPADRYATVQDFQAALRLYQSHSESVVLTDSASSNLTKALAADDYDYFSRAMYGFQEALTLWDGNRRAHSLQKHARAAYAQSALERGDLDLGISLLDPEEESHRDLLTKLEVQRQERESRARRLKLLKGMVAALLASVVGIVSVAFVFVRAERNVAVSQRDRAVRAEGEALENLEAAEAARKVADTQRQIAETEKERAENEKERAEREELRAKEQEQIAIQAKKDEEYEAYVARIGLAHAKIEENAFDRAEQLLIECNPELCHWEWGRLLHLCRLSQSSWHVNGPVEAVTFSPDGSQFATGDWDGKARLWDLETGVALHTLSHGQYVHAVAFDPEGGRLATGSSDHSVRIIDVKGGALLQTLRGHTDAVLSVQFSCDGRQVLTAGYDNSAKIWDLSTGTVLQTLRGHSWWVWAARFSRDDRRIVTASQDGKAIVWQQSGSGDYEVLTEFTKHRGPLYAAQFSPDGTHVVTAGYDRRVLLWNPDQVQPVDIARRLEELPDPPAPFHELAVHQGPVRSVVFSPDGSTIVSGGQDNVIRVWHLATSQEIAVLRGHASHVRDCDYSPDGRLLLSAGRDQQIKLWQPAEYGEALVLGGAENSDQKDAVLAARFSRDGSRIVTASRDRTATLWDAASQQRLQHFSEGHDFLASSSAFFANGNKLVTGAGDGTARVWDVASGTQILKLEQTGRTAALGVSDDSRWIATGGQNNQAIIWDARTGQRQAVLEGHEAAVTAVGFAPGGHLLATADDRGRCRLWERAAEGAPWTGTHWLRGHSRSIVALQFVDGGARLVTASGDNSCGQWDVASGQELTRLVLKHPDWVADMSVSANGSRALTCCDDGKLRVWSLDDARLERTIKPSSEGVFSSVDLSPDGQTAIAARAAQGTVQMWDLDSGHEIKPADPEREAWLEFGGRAGVIWAARFAPHGNQVLTIGGNDARLWDVATRKSLVRFSPHGAVSAADISPDGRLLATGSWDQSAKVWNTKTGQAVCKLAGVHQGYVNSVEFSPDGKSILTASDDGTARLWNAVTGAPLEIAFLGHEARVRQARFNAGGTRVLTTGNDKTARIWDASTGDALVTLVGHKWAVLSGKFSRDGERVITGSEDNTAIIWNAQSGQAELTLAGHTDSITSVAFSPDGVRVLTGSRDNVAKLWDARTGKEILTLAAHRDELTSVSFSPDGRMALTSGRDGATILWTAADWSAPRERQAAVGR